jgi:hypothetical protein
VNPEVITGNSLSDNNLVFSILNLLIQMHYMPSKQFFGFPSLISDNVGLLVSLAAGLTSSSTDDKSRVHWTEAESLGVLILDALETFLLLGVIRSSRECMLSSLMVSIPVFVLALKDAQARFVVPGVSSTTVGTTLALGGLTLASNVPITAS